MTELVAAGTINTMPETTLAAFADHGQVTGNTIRGRYRDACRVLDQQAPHRRRRRRRHRPTRARRPRQVREELEPTEPPRPADRIPWQMAHTRVHLSRAGGCSWPRSASGL